MTSEGASASACSIASRPRYGLAHGEAGLLEIHARRTTRCSAHPRRREWNGLERESLRRILPNASGVRGATRQQVPVPSVYLVRDLGQGFGSPMSPRRKVPVDPVSRASRTRHPCMNPEPEIPRPRSRSRHLSAPTVLKVIPRPLQRIMLSFVSPLDSQPFTCTFAVATIFPRFTRPKKGPRFRDLREPCAVGELEIRGARGLRNRAMRSPGHRGRNRHRHRPPPCTAASLLLGLSRWGDESFFMNL